MTLIISVATLALLIHEIQIYSSGIEQQHFIVEKSLGHNMQINLDITVAMPCDYLDINVQDAAGDRVVASELLLKEATTIEEARKAQTVTARARQDNINRGTAQVRSSSRRGAWKPRGKGTGDSCRVYGSVNVLRVLGDFHLTAKGHGYYNAQAHLDHNLFNFTHIIHELSFGDYYPKMINPLDGIDAFTNHNFYRYQYFLSIVPTLFESSARGYSVLTNQYSVHELEREIGFMSVPGIFFKYDIEPITLTISETRTPIMQLLLRLISTAGGIIVSGGWIYRLWEIASTAITRRGQTQPIGMLSGAAKS